MQRILVIGTSGSGKSTVALAIAKRLSLTYAPTDPFYWEPGWKPASSAKVDARLRAVLAEPAWVLDGNFDDRRDWVWARAEGIVWLDLPWLLTVYRVVTRNVCWALSRKPVWSGNTMSWSRAWSGVTHAARSHGLKRRLYPGWLAEVKGATVWRLGSSREIRAWLKTLPGQDPASGPS